MPRRTRFQYLFDKAQAIAQETAATKPSGGLPPLFFVTDPVRTPRPEDIAVDLPQGCGIIYRHFGEAEARQRGQRLKRIADDRRLILLIGEDVQLAVDIGADGVHLRQTSLARLADVYDAHPMLRLTAACHDGETLKGLADNAPLSAVFVSPVFISRSASAAGVRPLGVGGARDLAASTAFPVYGLGGITGDTIGELHGSGLSGIGAVDAFQLRD